MTTVFHFTLFSARMHNVTSQMSTINNQSSGLPITCDRGWRYNNNFISMNPSFNEWTCSLKTECVFTYPRKYTRITVTVLTKPRRTLRHRVSCQLGSTTASRRRPSTHPHLPLPTFRRTPATMPRSRFLRFCRPAASPCDGKIGQETYVSEPATSGTIHRALSAMHCEKSHSKKKDERNNSDYRTY